MISSAPCPPTSAARSSAGSSGTQPRSITSHPNRSSNAVSTTRLLSWICPSPRVAPSPASSSPLDSSATLGRRTTGTWVMPCEASTPRAIGFSTVPAASKGAPARISLPCRRILAPRRSGVSELTRPCASSSQFSCSCTQSAPAGTGAPVNTRAQVPACYGPGASPSNTVCDTGSGWACRSSKRRA
ncbi:hypothetical protein D3C76_1331480 [compost metagenome]